MVLGDIIVEQQASLIANTFIGKMKILLGVHLYLTQYV